LREQMTVAPREAARQLYVDDLVYDGGAIEHLVRTFGATQVMVGSDYPFAIMDRAPAARAEALPFDVPTKKLLAKENAERWLGLIGTGSAGQRAGSKGK
jgi:aminocarboxymuconate-semialdehyde decarboxylase